MAFRDFSSVLVFCAVAFAGATCHAQSPRSATLATDVNGFELGMPISEVGTKLKLERLGYGQYDGKDGMFAYNFEVTPLGRVYRITSQQTLGNFIVDQTFRLALRKKLSEKYGPPHDAIGSDMWTWRLVEKVENTEGEIQPIETMRMTASVTGVELEHTVEITLIDFRILAIDRARVNSKPRTNAEQEVKF